MPAATFSHKGRRKSRPGHKPPQAANATGNPNRHPLDLLPLWEKVAERSEVG